MAPARRAALTATTRSKSPSAAEASKYKASRAATPLCELHILSQEPIAIGADRALRVPSSDLDLRSAFSRTNVLQFINLPHSLHVPIIEAVRASWPKGVSSHGTPKVGGGKLGGGETIVDVWEVHLNGLVWGARGTRGGVAVRRLISQLLSTLSQHSWVLAASIDASFKDSSKDTLYLKRIERPPTTVSTLLRMLSLGANTLTAQFLSTIL